MLKRTKKKADKITHRNLRQLSSGELESIHAGKKATRKKATRKKAARKDPRGHAYGLLQDLDL